MTTRQNILNLYNSPNVQKLYEDLLGDFIQTWGIDCYYLPRTSESANGFNLLFGDDPTKKYTDNYQIEVYIQSVDQFEGGEFFSKFGDIVKKQARFLMPKRAYQREVDTTTYPRPREGDLIWVKNFNALFEIKFVDEEYFFYDFGKNNFYGFSLICEKFRFNDEKIDTGITEIDQIANNLSFVYTFQLQSNVYNFGTYTTGETVYQSNNNINTSPVTASAVVVSWNLPTGQLNLKQINGLFVPNANIFGANSGADWQLLSYDFLDSVNHQLADNDDIESSANSILNFSESNPFGNPG